MDNIFYIEINLRKGLFDAFGEDVKNSIKALGISSIESVRVSEVFRLQGDVSKKEAEKIAKKLFVDEVTQKFNVYVRPGKKTGNFVAEVWYKKAVTDPVALTAAKAIRDLGINRKITVNCGKKYYLEGNISRDELDAVCRKVLANPLIQDYFF